MQILGSTLHSSLSFSPVFLTESNLFWYCLKDLFPPHRLGSTSCPWPFKLMTSQVLEESWIRTGGYGRFRGDMGGKLSYRHALFVMSKRPCVTKRVPSVILRATNWPLNETLSKLAHFVSTANLLLFISNIFFLWAGGGGGVNIEGGLIKFNPDDGIS